MNHDHELTHDSSTAAEAAALHDAVAPGRSSRSAALCKCDHAVASGLVKAFTPPKLGVATTTVNVRSAPKTGAAKLRTVATDSVMRVQSEVQTTDPAYPQWFGVEIDRQDGFVAAPFVRIEDHPKDTQEAGTSSAQAAGSAGLSPAQAPGMNTDDPLFSGPLARMRREGEFFQIKSGAETGTLHKASMRVFQMKGYSGDTLRDKARTFRDAACNIMTLFFIARAPDLRALAEGLKDDYPGYKKLVEDWMTAYFLDALNSELVKESGWVTSNAALDQSEGCSTSDSPYQKAQGLLKCNGKLIRINVGGHFFVGEVKDGIFTPMTIEGMSPSAPASLT